MDADVAALLGLDLEDPDTRALDEATEQDMQLIERLAQIRRDRCLTQQDVAERMGCSQPNVSAFERVGGDPHLSTVRRYAVAVGARIRWGVVVDGDRDDSVVSVPFEPRVASSTHDTFYRAAAQ